MIFSKHMYYGKHAAEHRAYILENLRKGHFQPGAYVIVRAPEPNLYEIYNQAMFLNPKLDTETVEVLGVGYGYRDAIDCVTQMLKDRHIL